MDKIAITKPFILPSDVVLIPVDDLSAEMKEKIAGDSGDYAVTRPLARVPSKIIDGDSAALINEFRSQRTIVDAVISYSKKTGLNPEEILDGAFPVLQKLIYSQILVDPDSPEANPIVATFRVGDDFNDVILIDCVQTLEDTELYKGKDKNGKSVAIKVARQNEANPSLIEMFDREAFILKHLNGSVSPRLVDRGVYKGHHFLAMEWINGITAETAANKLRRYKKADVLLEMSSRILDAYDRLHSSGVIHSDVHPRNILVDDAHNVKIIDFGNSRLLNGDQKFSRASRAGIGFYFEPEYAATFLSPKAAPLSSFAGEQYAIAAAIYHILSGQHYLSFSAERNEMMRQIVEDQPCLEDNLTLTAKLDAVLARALHKDPDLRYSSVAEFCNTFNNTRSACLSAIGAAQRDTKNKLFLQIESQILQRVTSLTIEDLAPPKCSVAMGAAGIAYFLYRAAVIKNAPSLLSQADTWSTWAIANANSPDAFYSAEIDLTQETVGDSSLFHTLPGLYAVQALIAHALGDIVSLRAALSNFVVAGTAVTNNLDFMFGRPGILSTASSLAALIGKQNKLLEVEPIVSFGNELIEKIWRQIDSFDPIKDCKDFPSLGISHGWAGILYATLRWHKATESQPPQQISQRLLELSDCAEPIGETLAWKWRAPKPGQDSPNIFVSGWCNGTAGMVYLWTLAHKLFTQSEYLQLAQQAAKHCFLSETPSISDLCCGTTGRAYALLNLYKHTGDVDWLSRAIDLTNEAAIHFEHWGNRPDSLYKGKIGLASLLVDIQNPMLSCMPFFEDEGW